MKLHAEKVSKTFIRKGNGEKIALNEISFTIKDRSFCCITGESGRGKTTLLNILTGLLKPSSGEVLIEDKELYHDYTEKQRTRLRNHMIGYMMQGAALLENLTVYQNIVCPREIKGQTVPRETVVAILEKLNIASLQNSYPSEISGGEYRRVSLARTLLLNPEILVADEPTSNLDEQSASVVREVLWDYCHSGKSVIVVTHDKKFLDNKNFLQKKVINYSTITLDDRRE